MNFTRRKLLQTVASAVVASAAAPLAAKSELDGISDWLAATSSDDVAKCLKEVKRRQAVRFPYRYVTVPRAMFCEIRSQMPRLSRDFRAAYCPMNERGWASFIGPDDKVYLFYEGSISQSHPQMMDLNDLVRLGIIRGYDVNWGGRTFSFWSRSWDSVYAKSLSRR